MNQRVPKILAMLLVVLTLLCISIYAIYFIPVVHQYFAPYPNNIPKSRAYKDNSSPLNPQNPLDVSSNINQYVKYQVDSKTNTASVVSAQTTANNEFTKNDGIDIFMYNYVTLNGQVGNVTEIKPNAFTNRHYRSINLNEDLQVIDSYAFNHVKIDWIRFPENLKEIKPYAFHNTNLRAVYVPEGVQVDTNAFDSYTNVITVK